MVAKIYTDTKSIEDQSTILKGTKKVRNIEKLLRQKLQER